MNQTQMTRTQARRIITRWASKQIIYLQAPAEHWLKFELWMIFPGSNALPSFYFRYGELLKICKLLQNSFGIEILYEFLDTWYEPTVFQLLLNDVSDEEDLGKFGAAVPCYQVRKNLRSKSYLFLYKKAKRRETIKKILAISSALVVIFVLLLILIR